MSYVWKEKVLVRGLMLTACLFVSLFVPLVVYGAEIIVTNLTELNQALTNAVPGDEILLEEGTYTMTSQFALVPGCEQLTIRGLSGQRDAVVIQGQGMYGSVNHGFWVGHDNVTIQDLTIENVSNHCIQLGVNVDGFHVDNCILRDGYEQLLKVPYSSGEPNPSENGIVENCLFYYSAGQAPNYYTGGVDVHFGSGWIVRHNTFQDIQSPGGSIAEHAIHFWTDSENTLVEGNLIINCDRGVGFGLGTSQHHGGVIRNNMIYHDGSGDFADAGIILESASDAVVCNNTILLDHSRYPNAIEYRFSETSNACIANNLTNKLIVSRNGGTGVLEANHTGLQLSWCRDPSGGDLHLSGKIEGVVDQGVAVSGLVQDYDREPRPQGAGIDIGADEYSEGSLSMVPVLQPLLLD